MSGFTESSDNDTPALAYYVTGGLTHLSRENVNTLRSFARKRPSFMNRQVTMKYQRYTSSWG